MRHILYLLNRVSIMKAYAIKTSLAVCNLILSLSNTPCVTNTLSKGKRIWFDASDISGFSKSTFFSKER